MRWFKKKPVAADYVGKHVAFYGFRAGMGVMKHDFYIGIVLELKGNDTLIIDATHQTLETGGVRHFRFQDIRIADSWEQQ